MLGLGPGGLEPRNGRAPCPSSMAACRALLPPAAWHAPASLESGEFLAWGPGMESEHGVRAWSPRVEAKILLGFENDFWGGF